MCFTFKSLIPSELISNSSVDDWPLSAYCMPDTVVPESSVPAWLATLQHTLHASATQSLFLYVLMPFLVLSWCGILPLFIIWFEAWYRECFFKKLKQGNKPFYNVKVRLCLWTIGLKKISKYCYFVKRNCQTLQFSQLKMRYTKKILKILLNLFH